MTPGAGFALAVGLAGHPDAAVLSVGSDDDADVPLGPGDDLPFEDGVVATLRVGAFVHEMALAPHVRLLLECRRVLCAGGVLCIEPARDDAAATCLREQAALVGLEPCPTPRNGRALPW